MNLSVLDRVLWAAGFLGQTVLFTVLLYRRRWKEIPVFTALMGFEAALTVVLYWVYKDGSRGWYARIYWSYVLVDFLMQLGVVMEIAHVVLQPTGTWVRDARKQFFFSGAAGVLLAAALAWMVSPPASDLLDALEVRGNLFTSLVICELFVVMTLTANRLGLAWRSHVMALGQGLTAWASVAVLIDALHSYLGTERDFSTLEHVRMLVYLAALGYWMVQMWLDEPARQPISAELQEYILALHRRVEYDLGRINSER